VGVDGAGVHAEGARRDVAALARLGRDEEEAAAGVAAEDPFVLGQEARGVEARAVADAHGADGGDARLHERLLAGAPEEVGRGAGVLGGEERGVDARLQGLQEELRVLRVGRAGDEARALATVRGDEVLVGDDAPVARIDVDRLVAAGHLERLRLVFGSPDLHARRHQAIALVEARPVEAQHADAREPFGRLALRDEGGEARLQRRGHGGLGALGGQEDPDALYQRGFPKTARASSRVDLPCTRLVTARVMAEVSFFCHRCRPTETPEPPAASEPATIWRNARSVSALAPPLMTTG